MTPEIPPALTPGSWSELDAADLDNFRMKVAVYTGYKSAEIVAVANAALPDGDPRKITREDWHGLCRAAPHIGGVLEPFEASEMRQFLYFVAAKLAALLPPEE